VGISLAKLVLVQSDPKLLILAGQVQGSEHPVIDRQETAEISVSVPQLGAMVDLVHPCRHEDVVELPEGLREMGMMDGIGYATDHQQNGLRGRQRGTQRHPGKMKQHAKRNAGGERNRNVEEQRLKRMDAPRRHEVQRLRRVMDTMEAPQPFSCVRQTMHDIKCKLNAEQPGDRLDRQDEQRGVQDSGIAAQIGIERTMNIHAHESRSDH